MDVLVWNFAPSVADDNSLIFASSCGTVHKVDFDGRLLWKAVPAAQQKGELNVAKHGEKGFCSAGGGAVGPNGLFYTQWSSGTLQRTTHFAAYRVSTGEPVWTKDLAYGSKLANAQYPAVGMLGRDGPLAVVAAVGDIMALPELGGPLASGLSDEWYAQHPLQNSVLALDAETGAELWRSAEPPWPHEYGAGDDVASISARARDMLAGYAFPDMPFCWPDAQGIPLITGDGTVYTSSSHSGLLRAIRDANGNGAIEDEEVSAFPTGRAFLNGPSAAPGMLVAAPCWGPVYVFLDPDAATE